MIRLTDKIGDWLIDHLGARAQLRLGVILVLGSVPFLIYTPFTKEPMLVYLMSALALLLAGLGFLIGAEVLERQERVEDD